MNRHSAGFAESLVIEASLADLENVPVFTFQLFVDVDYVEIFVLFRNISSVFSFSVMCLSVQDTGTFSVRTIQSWCT